MPAWLQKFMDWANENPGKIIGILTGSMVFLLLVLLGPMFLFFILLVGGGFIFGKSLDDNVPVTTLLRRWLGKEAQYTDYEEPEDDDNTRPGDM